LISQEFKEFSNTLGRDFDLVQGAGGNTSLKTIHSLYVKASGFNLSEALDSEIFTEVSRNTNPLSASFTSLDGKRPSIETSFHMLMPQTIVAHFHAAHIIALSVLKDGRERLSEVLSGFRWTWVNYHRPGLPLAKAISKALNGTGNKAEADIIVLANHGIIVAGESVQDVAEKIKIISERAVKQTREQPYIDKCMPAAPPTALRDYVPARHAQAQALAFDEIGFGYACAGSLYPDHVVFLGRGAIGIAPHDPLPKNPKSKLIIINKVGVFLHKDCPETAHEMAGALGRIATLIPEGSDVNYLSHSQETELLEWEAEKYRTALAKAR
jgi:rhamnose utilization protein RhaD (predicted bifunctional aldolase and dehydrogenase)